MLLRMEDSKEESEVYCADVEVLGMVEGKVEEEGEEEEEEEVAAAAV